MDEQAIVAKLGEIATRLNGHEQVRRPRLIGSYAGIADGMSIAAGVGVRRRLKATASVGSLPAVRRAYATTCPHSCFRTII